MSPTFCWTTARFWLSLPTIGRSHAAQVVYQSEHGSLLERLRLFDAAVCRVAHHGAGAHRRRRPLSDPAVAPPCQFAVANALPKFNEKSSSWTRATSTILTAQSRMPFSGDKVRRFFKVSMNREYLRWYSQRLHRDMELLVFGHAGSGGVGLSDEGWTLLRNMNSSVWSPRSPDKLEAGHLQLYCVEGWPRKPLRFAKAIRRTAFTDTPFSRNIS